MTARRRLPKGVVTGVQLETVLRELSKAKGYHNFDELPIPFRAVATDLVTGKVVVFSEGELANVMRASMSVPGAVAPVEFGGMMLVDGMLTSNLPVEAARAMGADIIIAVNVGTPLLKREELNSILGVSGQMLSILTEQNVQASLALLKPTDILISPELGDFSTGDFDNLPQIGPLGEVAARKVADRLAQLSIPPPNTRRWRKRQLVAAAEPTAAGRDEIRFENLKRVNPETAQAVMETQVGQPIDQATIDGDMRRLYGTEISSMSTTAFGGARQAGACGGRGREILGAGLPALRPGTVQRLLRRCLLQPACQLSQDLAQLARCGMADRCADRAHPACHRVLSAAHMRKASSSSRRACRSNDARRPSTRATIVSPPMTSARARTRD